MRYISLCSGIEAASLAWKPLGWEPVAFSEIEPFPCALLQHYYPEVPNLGDLTEITREQIEAVGPVDVAVSGTPCQSFSVAGRRGGLDDPRGQLLWEFIRVVGLARPKWVVLENVRGLLSDGDGRSFGAFLRELAVLGYGFAYRVLDAQHFGVAQRRHRVFVVGCAGGDWRRAAAVLVERASLSGHPAPRREAGTETPSATTQRAAVSSGRGWWDESEVAPTMRPGGDQNNADAVLAITANGVGTGGHDVGAHGAASGHLIPDVAPDPGVFCAECEVYHDWPECCSIEGCDCSGADRAPPIPFDTTQITSGLNRSAPQPGDPGHPVAAGAHPPAIAFNLRGREGGAMPEVAPGNVASVRSASGGSSRSYIAFNPRQDPISREGVTEPHGAKDTGQAVCLPDVGVRRLMPVEVERLFGIPDDYTLIPYRGKPAADGPRYRALGNSMAVPVMRWIGERIAAVDTLDRRLT